MKKTCPPEAMAEMKLLIDGDILCYRAASSQDGHTLSGVTQKVEELFDEIFEATNSYATDSALDYTVYLTGEDNFRHTLTDTYKANRRDKEKPILLSFVRDYVANTYNAVVTDGEEADDAIAIEATRLYPNAVIISIDKDFRQVPGTIYNPLRKSWETITEKEGLLNFYQQVLTGDTADNIIGLYGIGPVKARKILEGCETEQEMFNACVEAYDGDIDRVILNGRLLWLRRKESQLWEPPTVAATDLD